MGELLLVKNFTVHTSGGDISSSLDISQYSGHMFMFSTAGNTALGTTRPQIALDPALTVWVDLYRRVDAGAPEPFYLGATLSIFTCFKALGYGLRLRLFGTIFAPNSISHLWRGYGDRDPIAHRNEVLASGTFSASGNSADINTSLFESERFTLVLSGDIGGGTLNIIETGVTTGAVLLLADPSTGGYLITGTDQAYFFLNCGTGMRLLLSNSITPALNWFIYH